MALSDAEPWDFDPYLDILPEYRPGYGDAEDMAEEEPASIAAPANRLIPCPYPKLDPSDIISMYAQMHTTEEIAKKYTVNPQAIIKCLRAHNIGIRSRWDYKKLD